MTRRMMCLAAAFLLSTTIAWAHGSWGNNQPRYWMPVGITAGGTTDIREGGTSPVIGGEISFVDGSGGYLSSIGLSYLGIYGDALFDPDNDRRRISFGIEMGYGMEPGIGFDGGVLRYDAAGTAIQWGWIVRVFFVPGYPAMPYVRYGRTFDGFSYAEFGAIFKYPIGMGR